MRNLSLSASASTVSPSANFVSTAIDLDENVLYAISERQNLDADVEVEIHKINLDEKGNSIEVTSPLVVARFATTVAPSSSSQVIAFNVIPEEHRLALIMRGGDIAMLSLDEGDQFEVEGSVEAGITGASWSPDESLLVLATADEKLILMTSTFDVLSETSLHASEFGGDAPINVGWGSKQTQFHGSLGKSAAQAQASPLASIGASPDDDGLPRISWRGDGSLFVVSTLSPPGADGAPSRRVLRVYDRQASLQSTAEAIAGLEHVLSWRPSGNLIATTQRFGFEGGGAGKEGRHDVVFFEKNGLRHGEFGLGEGHFKRRDDGTWGYKVRELSWSSDSTVLALWIQRDGEDVVQLWTTSNYHWYLKHEYSSSSPSRFTSVRWHPERPLHIIITTTTEIIHRRYAWETFASARVSPNDSGCVAVFDASHILLTPFRTQNVPPPMSSYQLPISSNLTAESAPMAPLTRNPAYAAFSPVDDRLAVLWESGHLDLWDLRIRLGPGRGQAMAPTKIKVWDAPADATLPRQMRQVVLGNRNASTDFVAMLGSEQGLQDILVVHELFAESERLFTVRMPGRNGRLASSHDGVLVWQAADGELFEVAYENELTTGVARFPEFCATYERISFASVPPSPFYVGLSASGKLHYCNSSTSKVVATNVNSFTSASGFVICTTTAHEALFAPFTVLAALLASEPNSKESPTDWQPRRVERGSRIVTAVPSTMSLVLQMPRGNLETINPRPLVMELVRQDLDAGNYRKAFFACRKHRIDLNVLVEHDEAGFLDHLDAFVDQIDEVDHINLFLTSIGRGNQSPETVARLCDATRAVLEKKDLSRYVNSILTAYVVKTPPDREAGLALLLRLRPSEPHLVEDAVKYIIFLVDADQLFDNALGMYDFSLVLMIAQHAQKDPREYLPFLRELRALEKYYQRFKINDHLKRYELALQNLRLAGPTHFEEAISYIEHHQLYQYALAIWKDSEQYNSVLSVYGDWLFERREWRQAASIFVEAGQMSKAMIAHEKALEWQELFDIAFRENTPLSDIKTMGYRVAEDLSSKKRHADAARVLLDYAKDVREAVIALVQGNHFSEARRITALHAAPEMLTDIIHPGALESCTQLVEEIGEMRDQLRKQVQRLRELRVKRAEEPDAFYGVEDTNLHNVDVMTDVSMPATAFTRYTVAPTSASRVSKMSSKTKRKMERKVGSGKKGTVDEEEYLLKSVTKLTVRFTTTRSEVTSLLPHLLQFSAEHRDEGMTLQDHLRSFELELDAALEEIWKKPSDTQNKTASGEDTWATRMQEIETAKQTSPMERVPKPVISVGDWLMRLFEVENSYPVKTSAR
ncbi:hypothetical protein PLICRDRAFT_96071 [Plicaturopsis crispa FD-325 SS-3]|nr:hypothetical protein PLICRDRAFT_96071 [Plicaturopsis crispa FD-325 SS-3]